MYTSFYNMPRRNNFMYPRHNSFGFSNNRLIGGGFAVPFLLGGITGSFLSNRPYYNYPNNFYYNNYYPYNPYYYPYY